MNRLWTGVTLGLILTACNVSPTSPTSNPQPTQIDSFGATPNPSPINVGVAFSWTVTGTSLTCTLDAEGDGTVDYTVQNCTSQSRVVHTYGAQGAFTARLAVTNAAGQSKSQVTPVTVGAANLPPTIPTLQPQLVASGDPLEVTFVWSVDDRNSDITHCQFDADSDGVLDYDNLCSGLPTTSTVKPSATVSHFFKYKYPKRGNYSATLKASDPYSSTFSAIKVRAPLNSLPVINTLTATTGPNNTASLAFRVSDPDDDPLACTLFVQSIGTFKYNNCRQLTRKFTFAGSGKYTATLEVADLFGKTTRSTTLQLGSSEPFTPILVVAGSYHNCGLGSNGQVYCWGGDDYGQLGNLTSVGSNTSTPLLVEGGHAFTQLIPAEYHNCALTSSGETYCWGYNKFGQLGNNINIDDSYSTNPIPALVAGVPAFVQLAAGDNHSCGLTADGKAYCWGKNLYGQLGSSTNNNTNTATPTPTEVTAAGLPAFDQLVAGSNHTCGRTSNGKAYCWGHNNVGQLGNDTNNNDTPNPTPTEVTMGTPPAFVQLTAGGSHTCGLTADGKVYCWGRNTFGQGGNNTNTGFANGSNPNPTPTEVTLGTPPAFVQVEAGANHTCGLTTEGKVYCWGNNIAGQLGNSTNFTVVPPNPNPTPTLIAGAPVFSQLSLGAFHTCGLTPDAQAYCWGNNSQGQLGSNGSVGVDTYTPTQINLPD
jgi:alpha-tubulin suppressor-like RCC1 family protein